MQQTSVSSVRTTSRDSNLELLRIVCMYMIILHHLIAHGLRCVGYSAYPMESFDFQRQFPFVILNAFCVVAVNCYVLISGYFGIKPTLKKLLNLFFICAFYSIIHYLIYTSINDVFSLKQFIFSFLPFSHTRGLWFVGCYIALFLISPLLNMAVCQLEKESFREWGICLLGLAIIAFYFGYFWRTGYNVDGYTLLNFIFLYMLGRFLYCHRSIWKRITACKALGMYGICSIVIALLALFVLTITSDAHLTFLIAWRYNSPVVIISAVFLFVFFTKLNMKSSFINSIAASTFSVYLIHENTYFRDVYLEPLHKISTELSMIQLFLLVFMGAFTILIVSILIDQIRIYLMKFLKL